MTPIELKLGQWRGTLLADAAGSVLEGGAGTGLNFSHYKSAARVVATEPAMGMINRARKRTGESGAQIVLVVADAEALPFRDHVFDEAVVGLAMCLNDESGSRNDRVLCDSGCDLPRQPLATLHVLRSAIFPIVATTKAIAPPAISCIAGNP